MNQSWRWSIIETWAQMIIGQIISLTVQVVLFWLMDIPVTIGQNLFIGAVFFCTSFIRSYTIRRIFNAIKR